MNYVLCFLLMLALSGFAEDRASLYDLDSSWINQRNEPVKLRDLRGKPRVLCMFFASCGYACPRITADMKTIEASLTPEQRERVGFIMASFDVERDTPDVLKIFADAKELGEDWQVLHGDEDAVRELAAALSVRYRREADGNFAHSNLILLIDAEGRIIHQRDGLENNLGDIIKAVNVLITP